MKKICKEKGERNKKILIGINAIAGIATVIGVVYSFANNKDRNVTTTSINNYGSIYNVENGNIENIHKDQSEGTSVTAIPQRTLEAYNYEKAIPSGYKIFVDKKHVLMNEIFHVVINPYEEDDHMNITIHAVGPSGVYFDKPLNEAGYQIYTESGEWKISAILENSYGKYIGQRDDEIITITVENRDVYENTFDELMHEMYQ